MGLLNALSSIFAGSNRAAEIIVLGLDNSGKSTLLNYLKPTEAQSATIQPTIGYSIERFTASGVNFSAYDMSGQSRYRNLWEAQFKTTNAIVFVVDSTDKLRLAVARDELWLILDAKDIAHKRIPILIFANKTDEKAALSSNEVSLSLGLDLCRHHDWNLVRSCALNGLGVSDGVEWLASAIKAMDP